MQRIFTRSLVLVSLGTLATLGGLTRAAQAQSFLLVPDSGNDRILSLNPFDGSILNANFITDAAFSTPIQAIDSGRGTILVSDQILDSVREYSLSGAFLGTVVGPGQGLDNIRGITVQGQDLYISVGGGTLTGTVQRFNLATNTLSTFATLPTASASPWGLLFRNNELLVTDSTSDDIERFSLTGTYIGKYYDSPGSADLNFPQQLAPRSNGNLLVAGFSVPAGVYEFTGALTGVKVGTYAAGVGQRGVWELGNGEVLYSGGTRLERINTTTSATTSIINQVGTSFRLFSSFTVSSAPEPTTLALLGLGILALPLRRRRSVSA
jgi:PEP-CTERM motif